MQNGDLRYVYLIAASPEGPCKIGVSSDPRRRLRQLQTAHPEKLQLWHQEPYDGARADLVEAMVHRTLSHKRTRGEWFSITVEDGILELKFATIWSDDKPDSALRPLP